MGKAQGKQIRDRAGAAGPAKGQGAARRAPGGKTRKSGGAPDAIRGREKWIPLSVFSSTRTLLMGLATVMILFVHSPFHVRGIFPNGVHRANALQAVDDLLFGGVDVFLLISGFGLYYSMHKDPHILSFYRKRFLRVVPELLLVSCVWLLLSTKSITLMNFRDDVLLRGFIKTGRRLYWFFNLLLLLYLIYPLIHATYDHLRVWGFLGLLALTVGVTIWAQYHWRKYPLYEIALTRIPAFLIGAWLGRLSLRKVRIPRFTLLIAASLPVAIYLVCFRRYIGPTNTWYYRYCAGLFCVSIAFLVACIYSKCRFGPIGRFLVWLGGYSLESYLVHEKTVLYFARFNEPTGLVRSFVCLIASFGLMILLKALNDRFQRELRERKQLA